jgi:periplasmic divalent cation tolerance protein
MNDEQAGVSVYVTVPDLESAESMARALVEEGLAACVNVLPGVRSIYRWEGELQSDDEVVLLAKTRAALGRRVCERVAELHSYKVPCAVVLPWVDAMPGYSRWVSEQTRGSGTAE